MSTPDGDDPAPRPVESTASILRRLATHTDGNALLHDLADSATVLLGDSTGAYALQQTRRLHSEVEVARLIQRSTLPATMPQPPGYDFHGHFLPATYAGGDLYDLVQIPQGIFLLLGDATGHGFGPALSATQMQGMLRVAFRLGADLDAAFLHVNNQLAEDLPDDRFITAFIGLLDPLTHRVQYHAAGQGPILHFHADTLTCEWRQPSTFPVGIMALEAPPSTMELVLAPGDILALLSDGIYECHGPGNALFGEARVAEVLHRHHAQPMATLSAELLDAARTFAAGTEQADDITLLLLRRLD